MPAPSPHLFKLGVPVDPDHPVESAQHAWAPGNIYQLQQTSGPRRLRIAPSDERLPLFWELAGVLEEPFLLLYVLHVSRCDNELGRYQSPSLGWPELTDFLSQHCEFLDRDARHLLWLRSHASDATIVWDAHNIFFAHGPIDEFLRVLRERHLRPGHIELPIPHVHNYHAEFDDAENRILRHFEWQRFDLRPGDRTG